MVFYALGLPGSGKTELSWYLASHIDAVYLRIDTIEQQLRNAGIKEIYDQG